MSAVQPSSILERRRRSAPRGLEVEMRVAELWHRGVFAAVALLLRSYVAGVLTPYQVFSAPRPPQTILLLPSHSSSERQGVGGYP